MRLRHATIVEITATLANANAGQKLAYFGYQPLLDEKEITGIHVSYSAETPGGTALTAAYSGIALPDLTQIQKVYATLYTQGPGGRWEYGIKDVPLTMLNLWLTKKYFPLAGIKVDWSKSYISVGGANTLLNNTGANDISYQFTVFYRSNAGAAQKLPTARYLQTFEVVPVNVGVLTNKIKLDTVPMLGKMRSLQLKNQDDAYRAPLGNYNGNAFLNNSYWVLALKGADQRSSITIPHNLLHPTLLPPGAATSANRFTAEDLEFCHEIDWVNSFVWFPVGMTPVAGNALCFTIQRD